MFYRCQQQHLLSVLLLSDDEFKKLEMRTQKSKAIYEKAKVYVPFGVHSTYRYSEPYPTYFSRAKGTKLWDADGNEYTDYNMGFGVLVAGHAHPLVVEAIREQAGNGTDFGFEWTETPKYAQMLCERFGVDQVRLSNTGGGSYDVCDSIRSKLHRQEQDHQVRRLLSWRE